MTDDRPTLTLAIIEGLKEKGLSQSEIARQFGVTRQAVSFQFGYRRATDQGLTYSH
jgi:transcriptional regulator